MLTLDECLGFCDLDPALIEALARHEQIPMIVAIELANSLLQTPRGIYRLHASMLDEIESAWNSGNHPAAKSLDQTYAGFRKRYPMPRVIS